MNGSLFAREYARVLDRLAPEERAAVQSWFSEVGKSEAEIAELKNFLNHPAISLEDKLRSLEAAAGSTFSPMVWRVVGDILKRRMTILFSSIAEEMARLADEARNIHSVFVTSASLLSEALQKELSDRLAGYLAGGVKVHYAVDPSLLSGLLVRIGDTVIDNSIRTDLEHLRRKFSAVSST